MGVGGGGGVGRVKGRGTCGSCRRAVKQRAAVSTSSLDGSALAVCVVADLRFESMIENFLCERAGSLSVA